MPTEQGWVHYRGLQQLGKVPVRFVLFPDEKHSLNKPAHQRRKLEEELAWFDQHLFGTHKDKNESLKKDSPLAWALQRQSALRSEGRLGVVDAGVLVPETVAHAGLHIGRFEVDGGPVSGVRSAIAAPATRAATTCRRAASPSIEPGPIATG